MKLRGDGPGRLPPPWSTYLAVALKTLSTENLIEKGGGSESRELVHLSMGTSPLLCPLVPQM
jgi:hypothetical protein